MTTEDTEGEEGTEDSGPKEEVRRQSAEGGPRRLKLFTAKNAKNTKTEPGIGFDHREN